MVRYEKAKLTLRHRFHPYSAGSGRDFSRQGGLTSRSGEDLTAGQECELTSGSSDPVVLMMQSANLRNRNDLSLRRQLSGPRHG